MCLTAPPSLQESRSAGFWASMPRYSGGALIALYHNTIKNKSHTHTTAEFVALCKKSAGSNKGSKVNATEAASNNEQCQHAATSVTCTEARIPATHRRTCRRLQAHTPNDNAVESPTYTRGKPNEDTHHEHNVFAGPQSPHICLT